MRGVHSEALRLATRIASIAREKLDTTGFRSTTPRYARTDELLSGVGARLHGGRRNPPGIAAVYLSLSPVTAMHEALAIAHYHNIPVQAAMPRTFVAVRVTLSKVLDLTIGINRQRLRVAEVRMLTADWRKDLDRGRVSLPQIVGRAGYESGMEALLVRSSVHPAGSNLIVFPQNLLKTGRLEILDRHRLGN